MKKRLDNLIEEYNSLEGSVMDEKLKKKIRYLLTEITEILLKYPELNKNIELNIYSL